MWITSRRTPSDLFANPPMCTARHVQNRRPPQEKFPVRTYRKRLVEEACRTVVAAQRAFTVGGGWDCTSNKATYARVTFAVGMPLRRCEGDCWSDADDEEIEEWALM